MKFKNYGLQSIFDDTIDKLSEADDQEMDPDWQKTPAFKARRKTTVSDSSMK